MSFKELQDVSPISAFVKSQFPPGAELIEVVTPDGRSYSGAELKAIEWQENNMQVVESGKTDIDQIVARLQAALPKKNRMRTLKNLFKFRHGKIMVCSDDSVWFLAPDVGACFERCEADFLPAIPQED